MPTTPPTPQVTYAGVPFLMPTPELQATVDRLMPFAEFRDWRFTVWPPRGMEHLPVPPKPEPPPVRLGVLYWPQGASRWSVFHGLMTADNIEKVRQSEPNAPDTFVAGGDFGCLLEVSDGEGAGIKTSMFMLPPRPISQGMGGDELYLVTLVDDRYYWYRRRLYNPTSSLGYEDTYATWDAILTQIAQGITQESNYPFQTFLTWDAVPSAYSTPQSSWGNPHYPPGVRLDTIARYLNMRMVRFLDGTAKVQGWRTANSSLASQMSQYASRKVMGGMFDSRYVNWGVPNGLGVVFPMCVGGTNRATYEFAVLLTSAISSEPLLSPLLAAAGLPRSGHPGDGDSAEYYADLIYSVATSSACTSLANQAAVDFYGWYLANQDIVFEGIVPWAPTGYDDCVIWEMSGDTCRTRVIRGPWGDPNIYNNRPNDRWFAAVIGGGSDAAGYTWQNASLQSSNTWAGDGGSSIAATAFRMASNTSGLDPGNPPDVAPGQFVLMRASPTQPGKYEFLAPGGLQRCQFTIYRYTESSGSLIETPHTVTIHGRDLTVVVD